MFHVKHFPKGASSTGVKFKLTLRLLRLTQLRGKNPAKGSGGAYLLAKEITMRRNGENCRSGVSREQRLSVGGGS